MRPQHSILVSLSGGLVALSILSMTGCASSPSQVNPDTRADIGYAANARYPGHAAAATPASANGNGSAAPASAAGTGAGTGAGVAIPAASSASPAAGAVSTTAVDHPRNKELEVYNLADTAIPDATVWVNGAYVRHIGTIPPRGSAMIRYNNLLQAGQPATDFLSTKQPVTKVEIQTPQGLYPASGPAIKS